MCEAKPECRFSNFYKIFILVSSASSVYDMSWDGRKYIDSRETRYLLRCVPCGLRHLHCWLRCHGYERAPYASFTRYADNIYVNLTLMARIAVGDIGFLVWDDIGQNNGTLGGTGCTAGGIKTTPLAVLLHCLSGIRRQGGSVIFGRRIEEESLKRATSILFVNLSLALTGVLLICGARPEFPLTDVLLEAISAIGTVGLISRRGLLAIWASLHRWF